jgi:hypothetical protein
MKSIIGESRGADDIVELRVVLNNRVIVSRVNYTHLGRVRQSLAAIERIRGDAVRIGLFELALSPWSVSHDFLSTAAVAPLESEQRDAMRRALRSAPLLGLRELAPRLA